MLFTAVFVATLSNYFKFLLIRTHAFYASLIFSCADVIDISRKTNKRYNFSQEDVQIQAMLSYPL